MHTADEIEQAFGGRVDDTVDKVGGLLPVEWSTELRHEVRSLVEDAYAAGAAHARTVDVELRRYF